MQMEMVMDGEEEKEEEEEEDDDDDDDDDDGDSLSGWTSLARIVPSCRKTHFISKRPPALYLKRIHDKKSFGVRLLREQLGDFTRLHNRRKVIIKI